MDLSVAWPHAQIVCRKNIFAYNLIIKLYTIFSVGQSLIVFVVSESVICNRADLRPNLGLERRFMPALKTTITAREIGKAIAKAIHEHKVLPGTKLGEDELSEIYGVSRTLVRSALQGLSHEQLVDIQPNRGAFVSKPSLREAREIFEARALLEPRTARSAALRMTKEAARRLQTHIDDEHEALAQNDIGKALWLSGVFHIEISKLADQATIGRFIESLIARSSLIIALYRKRDSALCEKHAHHALLEALSQKDGARAEELMQSHLVDLVSALDLREKVSNPTKLKDVLGGLGA